MTLEMRIQRQGSTVLVDGEDTELMSPQRRQWIMKKVMEKLDHRYLETVVGAIADKYGDLLFDDYMEADIYLHVV